MSAYPVRGYGVLSQPRQIGRAVVFTVGISMLGSTAMQPVRAQAGKAPATASRPAAPSRAAPAATAAPVNQAAARLDDKRWSELADESEESLAKGDFARAEARGRELVEEGKRVFAADHGNLATSYSILGSALFKQGKYPEAEAQFRLALGIFEVRAGAESLPVASALNNLALVLEKVADYPGAEVLLRRSLVILQKTHGANHADTATTMSNLGRVLDSQGKFGASAGIAAASVAAPSGNTDPKVLASEADALAARGQYREAESLQQRVVDIHERTVGREAPLTATSLSNLGNLLYVQGKFIEAERVHRRALAIREKVLGPEHPDTATSLNNLANVLLEQGKDEQLAPSEQRSRLRTELRAFTETENLYRRALGIQEKSLGADHPALAATLNNLGALLDQRGKAGESEPLQRRALQIQEKALGPLHPDTAATLTTLAVSLDRQGKIVEAEEIYRRAVESSRTAGNPRTLLLNASRLGFALAKRGRLREALPFYRLSIDTLDFLYVRTRGLTEETRAAFLGQYSNIYLETIKLLLQIHRANPTEGFDRQILEVASRNQSRIFTEMMRQADVARFSSEPAFVTLRNRRDALHERIDNLRQALVTIPPNTPNGDERKAELTAQFESSNKELAVIDGLMLRQYPRFMELTSPRPVTVADLQQKLLRPEEALISFVLLPQETVIFAVTRDRLKMAVSPIKREEIARRVYGIRRSIDKVAAGDSVLFLREIEPQTLYGLYRDLILPVADVLQGRAKVIAVPDGPLHTVPLEFLVTRFAQGDDRAFRATRSASDGSKERPFLSEYSPLEFLGKSHRFAYLPSLSALTSQRLYPKAQGKRSLELIAFADPDFDPVPGKGFSTATRSVLDSLGGNVPRKRDGTPEIIRLKETADEAREIAKILGGESELYFGDKAQEHQAKLGDLSTARFVLFATHGFLGGEFLPGQDPNVEAGANVVVRTPQKSGAQPALAMTLVGDLKGEDGMLTMKEVIEDVELNADLVALSACNTAGETAQANNGEGFAGLTRAFMYAGAKSLLVSHWSVDSLSTEALMTGTFRNIKAGRDALQAMSSSQNDLRAGTFANGEFNFSRSHPFFWAPFVYVGD